LSGTCDITVKEGKFIKLRHQDNKTIDLIVNQYRRAIKIVDKFPGDEIKCIDLFLAHTDSFVY
jgi:dsDNA-specific endonuclease/ATPase MutS2